MTCIQKTASLTAFVGAAILSLWAGVAQAVVVDLDDLALAAESHYDGADAAGEFSSRGATFNNSFTDFGGGVTTWEGWAYSNHTDTTTPGFANQYSALAGGGWDASSNYAVGFTTTFVLPAPIIELPTGKAPVSLRVTNTTYAGLSMRDGDSFAKKFGGAGGDEPDWFRLTITGLDDADQPVGEVEFYLADFRFADSDYDYILDEWANVNLTSLAGASQLSFALDSSDVGQFGMNTPAYFALDSLSVTGVYGDANDDDAVDIFDVAMVSEHWGEPGPAGDVNGDGAVDIFDVAMISDHWAPGASAVPEPDAGALAAVVVAAVCVLIVQRRSRRKQGAG